MLLNGSIRVARLSVLFILTLFCVQLRAQNLLEELVSISSLIAQNKNDEAYIQLQDIEDQCVHSDNDTLKVMFYESMGIIKFGRKEYQAAIKYFEPVPELYEKMHIKLGTYAASYLVLGMSYQHLGNDSLAEKYYRTGLLRTVNIDDSLDYRSSFYLNLGRLYQEKGDTLLAAECFKRINPQKNGSTLAGKATSLFDEREAQALEMRENGEFEQCLPVYDQLIKKCKETIGTKNEDYVRLLFQKALVLHYNLGRNSEAKPLFKELYEMRDDLPGFNEDILSSMARYLQIAAQEGDSLVVDSILPIALSYASRSNVERDIYMLYRLVGNGFYWGKYYIQAIPCYEKYNTMRQREDGLSYLEIPNMLAVCYLFTNSPVKAKGLLQELIDNYKVDLENNTTLKFLVYHNYGRALMLCGQRKEAIDYFVIANKAHRELTGEDNPTTQNYLEECKGHF